MEGDTGKRGRADWKIMTPKHLWSSCVEVFWILHRGSHWDRELATRPGCTLPSRTVPAGIGSSFPDNDDKRLWERIGGLYSNEFKRINVFVWICLLYHFEGVTDKEGRTKRELGAKKTETTESCTLHLADWLLRHQISFNWTLECIFGFRLTVQSCIWQASSDRRNDYSDQLLF